MYVGDAVRVLVRRWRVLLVGALVMFAGAIGVITTVPTTHEASGAVLFLLPPDARDPVNPYLNFQQGQTIAASLVGTIVTTPEEQSRMEQAGFTAEYAVAQSPSSTIPQLLITATDADGQAAVDTVKEIITRITDRLTAIQVDAGAPRDQLIYAYPFNVTETAVPVRGAKARALGVVGAVIGVVTLIAAFGLDRYRLLQQASAGRRGAPRSRGRRGRPRGFPRQGEREDAATVPVPETQGVDGSADLSSPEANGGGATSAEWSAPESTGRELDAIGVVRERDGVPSLTSRSSRR